MRQEKDRYIAKLYHRLFPRLLQYALSNLPGRALAEEAVQETFCIACLRRQELAQSPNPEGWLLKTLKNVIKNMYRQTRAEAEALCAFLQQRMQATPMEEDLELLYGDLSDSEAFQLLKELAVDGRSHLEMAEDRKISVPACKKRVQRAKEHLRKKIKL